MVQGFAARLGCSTIHFEIPPALLVLLVSEIHWNLKLCTWTLLEQGIDLKTDWQV